MKLEELKRLDEGRKLANEIMIGEQFLKVINDKDYVMNNLCFYKGRADGTNFPFWGDEFERAHREFVKKWVEDHLAVLKNKFEAL